MTNKFLTILVLFFGLTSFQLKAQSISDSTKLLTTKDSTLINPNDSSKIAKNNSQKVDEIINFAKTFMGVPYHYAGTSPSGFDCSGFIYYIMGNFGFQMSRTSYGLAELGESVTLKDIQPGDLLFFKGRNINSTGVGHVAMVVEVTPDAIMFIHASSSRGITMDNFKTSKYYIPRFLKAKRMNLGTDSEFLIR